MKNATLAYLAGAIDSDGTIGVKRSTYAQRVVKDSTQATYSERIALRQVTPEIVDLLKETFGGSVYITQPSAKNGRPLHSWSITDAAAFRCAKCLLPFLRVKKMQAQNLLALRALKGKSAKARVAKGRGHIGAACRPKALTAAMQICYEQAKLLNRVGI
jgi:hypothetical protein